MYCRYDFYAEVLRDLKIILKVHWGKKIEECYTTYLHAYLLIVYPGTPDGTVFARRHIPSA